MGWSSDDFQWSMVYRLEEELELNRYAPELGWSNGWIIEYLTGKIQLPMGHTPPTRCLWHRPDMRFQVFASGGVSPLRSNACRWPATEDA